MVAHAQKYPVVPCFCGNVDQCNAGFSGFAIAPRVFQQVGNCTGQVHLVGQHHNVFFHVDGDAHVGVIGHRVSGSVYHAVERHRQQLRRLGPGVMQEFVDDAVQLGNVGRHVFARINIAHTQFGFQPQSGQRCSQIMRNTRQHDDAVLFDFRELFRHAVEADVDFTHLAGGHHFVQPAFSEIAIPQAAGGE